MKNRMYRCEILAPSDMARVRWNAGFATDSELYFQLLDSLQRLRARSYLADGAIGYDQLTAEGRFAMPGDESSWHFVLAAGAGEVIGCVRYSVHDPAQVSMDNLRIAHVLRFVDADWGRRLRTAVEADLRLARERGSLYAELGGWAIAEKHRGTRVALDTLLASYAWGGLLDGGCIGSCTATVRHGSASILRRIGGAPMTAADGTLPAYWDPRYGCEMEVLRFDSREVQARYQPIVSELQRTIQGRRAIQAPSGEAWFRKSLLALGDAVSVRRGPVPEPVESGEEVWVGRGV